MDRAPRILVVEDAPSIIELLELHLAREGYAVQVARDGLAALEAFERDHRLIVRVELPGLKKEEIGVTFTEGTLTIEGERKLENEEQKNEWYRNERTYGKFVRTLPLPEGVKSNEIKATFEGGVLEITVPLPETPAAAAPKKVEITGAEEKKTVKAA